MISRFLIIDFQTRNENESIIIKVLASQFLIFNFSSIAKLWKQSVVYSTNRRKHAFSWFWMPFIVHKTFV